MFALYFYFLSVAASQETEVHFWIQFFKKINIFIRNQNAFAIAGLTVIA